MNRPKIALGSLMPLLFVIVGCGTNPDVAFPPAEKVVMRTGPRTSAELATLSRGRKIYTTACTECHVARRIGNYSIPQWRHYIRIMAPRAGLEPADQAALENYILKARQSLPPG